MLPKNNIYKAILDMINLTSPSTVCNRLVFILDSCPTYNIYRTHPRALSFKAVQPRRGHARWCNLEESDPHDSL